MCVCVCVCACVYIYVEVLIILHAVVMAISGEHGCEMHGDVPCGGRERVVHSNISQRITDLHARTAYRITCYRCHVTVY